MSERLENLKWLLVDLMLDVSSPAQIYRLYRAHPKFDPKDSFFIGICRVCNSHTILALCKLCEIVEKYGQEIRIFPALHQELNILKAELESRNIYSFRSKSVAHIHVIGTKAPLPFDEAYALLEKIVGASLDEFYDWVCPESDSGQRGILDMVFELKEECIKRVGNTSRQKP